MLIMFLRQQKTLDLFVLEIIQRIILIKIVVSIELLLISWLKQVISLDIMELEVFPFMEPSSLMKILKLNTLKEDFYLWLMLDLILMVHNFL